MTDTRTHRVNLGSGGAAVSQPTPPIYASVIKVTVGEGGRTLGPLDVIWGAGGDGQPMPLVGHAPEPEHRSGWAIAVAAVAVGIIVLPLLAVGLNWALAEMLGAYWRMGE